MKYLTTLGVARQIGVSKQTLLNWLYAGKVPEPPRNKKGYRLWSPSRVSLVRKLIDDGRIHQRTLVHRPVSSRPGVIAEFAREISQFLRDAQTEPTTFLRELARVAPQLAPFIRVREKRRPSTPPRREPEPGRAVPARARPTGETPPRQPPPNGSSQGTP